MKVMRVIGRADTDARVAGANKLDTLEDVLRWGGHVVEVIVQDEYTHDVIVEKAGVIYVFDTT